MKPFETGEKRNGQISLSLSPSLSHGAMGRRIKSHTVDPLGFSRSSQCSTNGVLKIVACAILSEG